MPIDLVPDGLFQFRNQLLKPTLSQFPGTDGLLS
jgi:hypothetical protein